MSRNLLNAKKDKNDEFYTQLEDIEKELFHYKEIFKEKIVYCNCDNPLWSNFFKFLVKYGKEWDIKEAWFSNYAKDKKRQLTMFDNMSKNEGENVALYWRYIPKLNKTIKKQLKGDGDFRSEESIELLKQADIVVTNPPFSLFREYVAQLIKYDKKFIIIGNKNVITYKEIFALIKTNKLWLGYRNMGADMLFSVTDKYAKQLVKTKKEGSAYRYIDGQLYARVPAVWFTNLETEKRHEWLDIYKQYNEKEYPYYDNYKAINVNKTCEIPDNYYGIMGVPITFLDKYNPDQFEIIGDSRYHDGQDYPDDINFVDGNGLYRRILIRRKKHAN